MGDQRIIGCQLLQFEVWYSPRALTAPEPPQPHSPNSPTVLLPSPESALSLAAAFFPPQLHDCVTYHFGPPVGHVGPAPEGYGRVRFLAKDYSIDCDARTFQRVQWTSYVFTVAYGLGTPLSVLVVGRVLRHTYGNLVELQTFAFLMIGYKSEYKYWETV